MKRRGRREEEEDEKITREDEDEDEGEGGGGGEGEDEDEQTCRYSNGLCSFACFQMPPHLLSLAHLVTNPYFGERKK